MEAIFDILVKISEYSVTIGAAAKGLIVFLSGFFASKKLIKKPEDS